jgi:small-conductance mechanosensitive channel
MPAFVSSQMFTLSLLLLAVAVVVLAIGRANRFVPQGSRLEAWVQRWSATGQALVVSLALLWAIGSIYGGDPSTWRWLTLGTFLVMFWSVRGPLTDWANGLMLRSEGSLRPGGRIGATSGRGRIRRLGLRSAEVEAEDGRLLRLPYSGLAAGSIEISSEEVAARSHTFSVAVPEGADAGAVSSRMTSQALLSPWSAAQPAPSVRLLERSDGLLHFEVTVYPVDPAYLSRIEDAVRSTAAGGAPDQSSA